MSSWALIQIVFDIFAALGLFLVIMRMSRAPKDDPRLSRGLQLLQSKISVLEDLSDRTEVQVGQLNAILEQKAREVQAKVQLAEQHVHAIRVAMDRSLEVAKIFQDKIPHQEIIERQNTLKYVQAARMAHQGAAIEEIASRVDLPKGEIEFIAKVNRERLMFNEEQLPWWAKPDSDQEQPALPSEPENPVLIYPQSKPGARFRAASPDGFQDSSASTAQDEINSSLFMAELPDLTLIQEGFGEPAEVPGPSVNGVEENTKRLKAEMELAEHQRLVENLSRLQFEMQNLDIQLAKENATRSLSQAFEVPPPPSSSLARLGEEFRKACEEAEGPGESRGHGFAPLEQLQNLIPKSLFAPSSDPVAARTDFSSHETTASQGLAQEPLATNAPLSTVAPTEEPAEPPRDAALARASSQAKVQAALRTGAQSMAKTQAQLQNSDQVLAGETGRSNSVQQLEMARNLAREAAVQIPNSMVAAPIRTEAEPVNRIINGRGKLGEAPVIRRIEFPRID